MTRPPVPDHPTPPADPPGARDFVLTLACPDRVGIVRAVSGFLADRDCNIVDSQQFSARDTARFFLRTRFTVRHPEATLEALQVGFAPIGAAYGMQWQLYEAAARGRVLVMVSKLSHCLNDLLYRYRIGALPGDIVAVVSNHPDCETFTAPYQIPYHLLPVTRETRAQQEARIMDLVHEYQADLVVLARYMQILSDDLCQKLAGRAINIHHSFLPSFKGGKPYHQAYQHGVKLIGATAHYVTADLDEGPIIEQEVARVDHAHTVDQLVAVGRDTESLVLARAVTWHLEHRVIPNGNKTVVFR
ncbi:MAG TPA: formyltetrahydrofolate deformylase [Micromonosporaceae bacterium]